MNKTASFFIDRIARVMIAVMVLSLSTGLFPAVDNGAAPLKGPWDFKPAEVWSIDSVGEAVLARPGEVLPAPDGTVYLYDSKPGIYYMFNSEGKYIKTFAKKGEGPGEVRSRGDMFLVKDKLVITDINRVHYFKRDGSYLKTVQVETNFGRAQCRFIDEKQMILAPTYKAFAKDGMGKICLLDLESGSKKELASFTLPESCYVSFGERKVAISVPPLTAHLRLGYDDGSVSGTRRVLYGVNHTYAISSVDLEGKSVGAFTLKRAAREMTKQEKREKILQGKTQLGPMDQKIIGATPDTLTFFERIEVQEGLIYVFQRELGKTVVEQWLDIFSTRGKYLYRGRITAGEGNRFFMPFSNLVFCGGYLYAVIENEDGDMVLRKFKITSPSKS